MNCYICGCVKNCDKYLDKIFINIDKMRNFFKNTKIIISYDISTDKTYDLLKKYQQLDKNIIILENNNKLSKKRVENISNARNLILKYIKNDNNKYEYFIMMDFDDVCSNKIKINILHEVLQQKDRWDCISFNKSGYYDIWALAYNQFIISWQHIFQNKSNAVLYLNDVKKNIINDLKKNIFLEVDSAFNGFAIYKTNKFLHEEIYYDFKFKKNIDLYNQTELIKNTNYINNNNFNETISINNLKYNMIDDCEHKYFHKMAKLINNCKIIIYNKSIF